MRVLLAGPDFEENLFVRYLASSLEANGHEVEDLVMSLDPKAKSEDASAIAFT